MNGEIEAKREAVFSCLHSIVGILSSDDIKLLSERQSEVEVSCRDLNHEAQVMAIYNRGAEMKQIVNSLDDNSVDVVVIRLINSMRDLVIEGGEE